MDDNTAKVLLATLPAAITGGLTWYLTRRSARLLYEQKWWDRKAQAYDNIIGALIDLEVILDEWEPHFTGVRRLSEKYQTDLSSRRWAAVQTIKKLSLTGDFLITEIAADALRKCAGAIDSDLGLDIMDEIEKDSKALKTCLYFIKSEAATDLRFRN